jgi:hypothetical protein
MNLTHSVVSNIQNNVISSSQVEPYNIHKELDVVDVYAIEEELTLYKNRVEQLEKELEDTKEKLKKYTAPERNKLYYQKNKDKLQTPEQKEKRKEINKKAYEKRKLSKQNSILL